MNTKLLLSIRELVKNQKIKRDKYIIAFDLDETLWSFIPVESSEEPEPFLENIKVVNELFKDDSLIVALYTARPIGEYSETVQLLEKFGVNYHSIQFGKMRFDVLVDDKCINPYKP